MVFVDATKYMKVQDDDLAHTFSSARASHDSTGGRGPYDDPDSKYTKASFESFQIEPTRYEGQSSSSFWQSRRVVIVGVVVVVAILAALGGVLALFLMEDATASEGGDDSYASSGVDTGGSSAGTIEGVATAGATGPDSLGLLPAVTDAMVSTISRRILRRFKS